MVTEENGCDCPNCESGKGDCLAGFCAVCLTELGTGEPWGATCGSCGGEVAQTLTNHTGSRWWVHGTETTDNGTRVVTWTNGTELVEEVTRPTFTHWVLADVRGQVSVSVDSLAEILAELDWWRA